MSIWDRMCRERLEYCNGRINTAPGNWVFEPTQTQIARTIDSNPYSFRNSTDRTGRKMYLIKQQGVWCTNPEIGNGYPHDKDHDFWYLPAAVCRKCPHYVGRKRGKRYASCSWAKEKRGGAKGAAQSVVDTLDKAVEMANQIMGKG